MIIGIADALLDFCFFPRMQKQVTTSAATTHFLTLDTRMTGSTGKWKHGEINSFYKQREGILEARIYGESVKILQPFCSHGTRCAGEVSGARDNGVCGVGVAYDSQIAGTARIEVHTKAGRHCCTHIGEVAHEM